MGTVPARTPRDPAGPEDRPRAADQLWANLFPPGVKAPPTGNYSIAFDAILALPAKLLSDGTKLVLLGIQFRPTASDKDPVCWRSIPNIAKRLGKSERQLYRYIHAAEAEGWLRVERTPGKTSRVHVQIPERALAAVLKGLATPDSTDRGKRPRKGSTPDTTVRVTPVSTVTPPLSVVSGVTPVSTVTLSENGSLSEKTTKSGIRPPDGGIFSTQGDDPEQRTGAGTDPDSQREYQAMLAAVRASEERNRRRGIPAAPQFSPKERRAPMPPGPELFQPTYEPPPRTPEEQADHDRHVAHLAKRAEYQKRCQAEAAEQAAAKGRADAERAERALAQQREAGQRLRTLARNLAESRALGDPWDFLEREACVFDGTTELMLRLATQAAAEDPLDREDYDRRKAAWYELVAAHRERCELDQARLAARRAREARSEPDPPTDPGPDGQPQPAPSPPATPAPAVVAAPPEPPPDPHVEQFRRLSALVRALPTKGGDVETCARRMVHVLDWRLNEGSDFLEDFKGICVAVRRGKLEAEALVDSIRQGMNRDSISPGAVFWTALKRHGYQDPCRPGSNFKRNRDGKRRRRGAGGSGSGIDLADLVALTTKRSLKGQATARAMA